MAVSLDIAISMQSALQSKLDVLSNNGANMGVHGFQSDSVIFAEFLGQGAGSETYSYLNDVATMRDLNNGTLEKTSNTYHVALRDKGYFAIQTPNGILYTRQGAFATNPEGILVNLNGDPVLSMDGGEIAIPAESTQITISSDGNISDENGIIAKLGIFGFENEFDMIKRGNTQLTTTQAAIPLDDTANVAQGYLEKSNVNPIKNVYEMMETSKLYKINQRYIEEQLKLQSTSTEQLATTAPEA